MSCVLRMRWAGRGCEAHLHMDPHVPQEPGVRTASGPARQTGCSFSQRVGWKWPVPVRNWWGAIYWPSTPQRNYFSAVYVHQDFLLLQKGKWDHSGFHVCKIPWFRWRTEFLFRSDGPQPRSQELYLAQRKLWPIQISTHFPSQKASRLKSSAGIYVHKTACKSACRPSHQTVTGSRKSKGLQSWYKVVDKASHSSKPFMQKVQRSRPRGKADNRNLPWTGFWKISEGNMSLLTQLHFYETTKETTIYWVWTTMQLAGSGRNYAHILSDLILTTLQIGTINMPSLPDSTKWQNGDERPDLCSCALEGFVPEGRGSNVGRAGRAQFSAGHAPTKDDSLKVRRHALQCTRYW